MATLARPGDMSCREKRSGDALRLCTDILLCREEYAGKYVELRSLVESPKSSAKLNSFFKRAFAFEQFATARTEWEDKLAEVDVLDIVERRKLNHEEFDYVTTVLKRVSARVRNNSYDQRMLAGIAASLNARAFAEKLARQTEGCTLCGGEGS